MKKEFKDYNGQDGYLYFYADWCDICKMAEPVVNKISEEDDVYYCNVDNYFKEACDYGVASVPTLILIKDEELVDAWVGTDISKVKENRR